MQNVNNHRRFFPIYHFVLIPISITAFGWSLTNLGLNLENWKHELPMCLATFCIVLGAFISRIYALKNQDRIIRLEMRYRYFDLSGKSFSEKEQQLRLSQIIALRFAGDDELISLVDESISKKLSNSEIKKSIQNWKEDTRRI